MSSQPLSAKKHHILLIVMGQSPFNRSIWTGFHDAFQSVGNTVEVVDATAVPDPSALAQRPDLVFAVHGGNVPPEKIARFREQGIECAVYLLDEPYEVDRSLEWSRHYDRVFSVDRATVPIHAGFTNAHFLPLAYNAGIFSPEGPEIASRILVLGTPFKAREEYLSAICERWADLVTWVGPGWKNFDTRGTHFEQYVTPFDCARFYRGADIVINIHRDSTWSHFGEHNKNHIDATHLNPRFWETAACGSLQLCSYREDLDRFHFDGCSFKNAGELVDKLGYYLDNKSARQKLAKQLLKKLDKHSYLDRARSVLDTVFGVE